MPEQFTKDPGRKEATTSRRGRTITQSTRPSPQESDFFNKGSASPCGEACFPLRLSSSLASEAFSLEGDPSHEHHAQHRSGASPVPCCHPATLSRSLRQARGRRLRAGPTRTG